MRHDPSLSFFVPGPMPGLNDLIRAKGAHQKHAYNGLKKRWQATVAGALLLALIGPQEPGLWWFEFVYVEQHRRRNPDNVAAGARKFIFDALVQSGVLANDGWSEVAGWSDTFTVVSGRPGVAVTMKRLGHGGPVSPVRLRA